MENNNEPKLGSSWKRHLDFIWNRLQGIGLTFFASVLFSYHIAKEQLKKLISRYIPKDTPEDGR